MISKVNKLITLKLFLTALPSLFFVVALNAKRLKIEKINNLINKRQKKKKKRVNL